MYDVIYIDAHGAETRVAKELLERGAATELAKRTAVERGAGRMMLPGSMRPSNCVCVVPVHVPEAA